MQRRNPISRVKALLLQYMYGRCVASYRTTLKGESKLVNIDKPLIRCSLVSCLIGVKLMILSAAERRKLVKGKLNETITNKTVNKGEWVQGWSVVLLIILCYQMSSPISSFGFRDASVPQSSQGFGAAGDDAGFSMSPESSTTTSP